MTQSIGAFTITLQSLVSVEVHQIPQTLLQAN